MRHSLDLNCFLLKPDLPHKAGVEHVKAWLEYKAGYYCEGDPDSSCEARDFYRIMWGEFLNDTGFELRPKPRGFSKNPNKYVQGDWMCSVWTTVKYGLKQAYKKGFVKTEDTFDVFLKNFDDFGEVFGDTRLQEFIRSAYTYANLIIVPDGFNSARNLPTQDYWDKTMSLYFDKFDSKHPLQYKKKENGEIIDYDCGTPFRKLVEKSRENGSDRLFLDDWLDKDNNPIPLLDKELNKPYKPDDWRKLMEEMTKRIDKRREIMQVRINELMKQEWLLLQAFCHTRSTLFRHAPYPPMPIAPATTTPL